jgi:hypothetical protein
MTAKIYRIEIEMPDSTIRTVPIEAKSKDEALFYLREMLQENQKVIIKSSS